MAEFDDNDEVQKFRQWWASNGTSIVIGVLIAVLVVGGWYGWQWYTARQNTTAAHMYAEVQYGIASDQVTAGVENVYAKLKSDYSGTPYAGAATLLMSAYQMHKKHFDKAANELDWAMHHAKGAGIRQVATVRKARVLWAENKPKAALELLGKPHPAAFDSLFAELAGDIHAAEGDRKAAHQSYEKALAALPSGASNAVLERKLRMYAPAAGGDSVKPDSKTASS